MGVWLVRAQAGCGTIPGCGCVFWVGAYVEADGRHAALWATAAGLLATWKVLRCRGFRRETRVSIPLPSTGDRKDSSSAAIRGGQLDNSRHASKGGRTGGGDAIKLAVEKRHLFIWGVPRQGDLAFAIGGFLSSP